MKKSVESPKLTFSPYPVKLMAGEPHKVAFEFNLLQEITQIPIDAIMQIMINFGGIQIPKLNIEVINHFLFHIM